MKGQVAVEYLFILALALAIIVPGSMLFFNYSKGSNEKLVASQINRIGNNIINHAEEMYTIGKNSWVTIDVNFPDSTEEVYTTPDNSELIIKYNTPRGITEAVFFTDAPILGSYEGYISSEFHQGHMNLKIESKGDEVLIGEPIIS
jgi:uncharacterized Fe-S center protein